MRAHGFAYNRQPPCTDTAPAAILQVSIWILSPGISFAYRFDPLRVAGRTSRGRGAHIFSTFSIVGREMSKSCERFSSLCMRREPSPLARNSAIHCRSRSETLLVGDLGGRRDSLDQTVQSAFLIPPNPLPQRRSRDAALQANLRTVLQLFKQLDPLESLPNLRTHSVQGNWKRCLLTTHVTYTKFWTLPDPGASWCEKHRVLLRLHRPRPIQNGHIESFKQSAR